MEPLQVFSNDTASKQAVLDFIHDFLDRAALERVYKRGDISHIADARELIDKAFEELEMSYKQKPTSDTTNQSR